MTDNENGFKPTTPFHRPEPITEPRNGSDKVADGLLRVIFLIISLISLGIAMISVAYVSIELLVFDNQDMRDNILPVIVVIALAYSVGWIVALVGIRLYHNLVLPMALEVYAWATLVGISLLYIAILYRLYEQQYPAASFMKYTIVMWVTLAGLIGIHLLIEGHSLRLFSIPLLIIAFVHLYLIVYHYIFAFNVEKSKYLVGDITFFLGMVTVSILMLMHVGMLSGMRNTVNSLFEKRREDDLELEE